MSTAAVAGACVAVVLVAATGAAHPAQVVVAVSAGCAFVVVLRLGRKARLVDWLTVRLLLAGNLVVFGVGNFHQLGVLLGGFAVVSGALLIATAVGSYVRQRERRDDGQ